MKTITMSDGGKTSKKKKTSVLDHDSLMLFMIFMSIMLIIVTIITFVFIWYKQGQIHEKFFLTTGIIITYCFGIMLFSRFRIERKREERIELLIDDLASQIKSQLKGKSIDDLSNKTFEGVVLEQERQAFSQYLSEISGDAELYYKLAKAQYERAMTIYEKKKFNEALKVLELSKSLYRIAYSIEKPKSIHDKDLKDLVGLMKEIDASSGQDIIDSNQ